jgi:hypothetical protein
MAYAEMEAAETSTNDWEEYDVLYARALIAKLIEGMDTRERDPIAYGWLSALAEIRRRAGLEDLI